LRLLWFAAMAAETAKKASAMTLAVKKLRDCMRIVVPLQCFEQLECHAAGIAFFFTRIR
jgi:hypothetical protein